MKMLFFGEVHGTALQKLKAYQSDNKSVFSIDTHFNQRVEEENQQKRDRVQRVHQDRIDTLSLAAHIADSVGGTVAVQMAVELKQKESEKDRR